MRIVKPSSRIIGFTPNLEQLIEEAGRVCYKSEVKIDHDSSGKFIERLHDSKHESVLEHAAITVNITCDRGVSHELVRHRIASYSQESTRYCNYSKDKFKHEISVIDPRKVYGWDDSSASYIIWFKAMCYAESMYFALLDAGETPEKARGVLPTDLKTEIVITANPREWLHIFRERTSSKAHPKMREIMLPLAEDFSVLWPFVFKEFSREEGVPA